MTEEFRDSEPNRKYLPKETLIERERKRVVGEERNPTVQYFINKT